ncbi:hypothetical protein TWF192_010076 [Orbilia oligospora]|uniref:Uncharacterized protein n=1 Tax=Orbilia oligospora TaxID=2813651 RepID=A0A6G1M030_ORBOL|nr:hypothetical protein TWF191_000085 [Orbilia oligospora]KAF3239381.1 hypothetical protein TWF192_010076 [Orbilia oligospora]
MAETQLRSLATRQGRSLHDSGFNPKNGNIEIVQPPCRDHIDTVEAYAAEIKSAGKTSKLSKVNAKVWVPERLVETWTRLGEDASRNLAAIEAYNRTFGTLVASSDYKIDSESKNSIDWAMFKISGERSPQNVTEVIFGIISGVKDGVSLKENKGETMERCVVGKNGADFSAARDSGSLVFNETFQVVGLLTAGCDSVGLITYLLKIELDSILSKPPLSEYMEPNWHREIFEMDLEDSKC